MTKVFIGGSRNIRKLSSSVTARIDNIIERKFIILVGDAYGADTCIQRYLAEKQYENVVVFHAGHVCRNNIGNWETRAVPANFNQKGFEFYAVKDFEMARASDYGLMIWDAISKGTLNNVLNLLNEGRTVLVFFAPDQSFHTIRNPKTLSSLLLKCSEQALTIFEEKLGLSKRLIQSAAKNNILS